MQLHKSINTNASPITSSAFDVKLEAKLDDFFNLPPQKNLPALRDSQNFKQRPIKTLETTLCAQTNSDAIEKGIGKKTCFSPAYKRFVLNKIIELIILKTMVAGSGMLNAVMGVCGSMPTSSRMPLSVPVS